MAILHDNRNMRPDLLDEPVQDVDDIFAAADAQMSEQYQKRMFMPSQKKKDFKKRLKRSFIISTILTMVIIIVLSAFAVYKGYHMFVDNVKTEVMNTVVEMQNTINQKDKAELTEEEKLLRDIFSVVSNQDIENMLDKATSIEEIIAILQTETLETNKYLTKTQQKQLTEIFERYANGLEERIEEMEATIETTENTEKTVELIEETTPDIGDSSDGTKPEN